MASSEIRKCKTIGRRLAETIMERLGITEQIQRHLASCPRCRRRAEGAAKVGLALMLLKTAAHGADLLSRANGKAIAMLSRAVRETPQAQSLRAATPRATLRSRFDRYSQSIAHAAACLAVLGLVRWGLLDSMNRVQDEGKQIAEQYYTRNLDKDISDQII